jgi:hypothetical protein
MNRLSGCLRKSGNDAPRQLASLWLMGWSAIRASAGHVAHNGLLRTKMPRSSQPDAYDKTGLLVLKRSRKITTAILAGDGDRDQMGRKRARRLQATRYLQSSPEARLDCWQRRLPHGVRRMDLGQFISFVCCYRGSRLTDAFIGC